MRLFLYRIKIREIHDTFRIVDTDIIMYQLLPEQIQFGSESSSVSTVTRLRAERPQFDSGQGQ
jgi:hypothetical protein